MNATRAAAPSPRLAKASKPKTAAQQQRIGPTLASQAKAKDGQRLQHAEHPQRAVDAQLDHPDAADGAAGQAGPPAGGVGGQPIWVVLKSRYRGRTWSPAPSPCCRRSLYSRTKAMMNSAWLPAVARDELAGTAARPLPAGSSAARRTPRLFRQQVQTKPGSMNAADHPEHDCHGWLSARISPSALGTRLAAL
jgi:hypothetical protein